MSEPAAADDYRAARAAFLAACARRDHPVRHYPHPLPGPDGQPIATDVVRIGPADAARLLIITSGTHGVEGYAGSHAQRACLDWLDPERLGADRAVLLIHMINPWGTAWRRRHNEDNIDLNRHFIDRTLPAPANERHAELVRLGFLKSLAAPTPADALARLDRFRRDHGDDAYAQAVFQGQYDEPAGLGFGGAAPCWSDVTLKEALRDLAGDPGHVALIDLHTGLGPFGVGTLLCTEAPGSSDTPVLREWYDESFVALLEDRQTMPYQVQGDIAHGVRPALPRARVLPISLEFGTYSAERFATLMVEDGWAQRQPASDPAVEAIRCDLVHFFHPRSALWRSMVERRTLAVVAMALAGLSAL